MLVPNRNYSSPSYRYGFQGQEKDDEVKGSGNSLNYMFRMHDPRVGRFFAVDPLAKKYNFYSPYGFSGNKVISHKEVEGGEDLIATLPEENGESFFHTSVGEPIKILIMTSTLEKLGEKTSAYAYSIAYKKLGKGNLMGSNGKIYTTTRMTIKDITLIDGTVVENVVIGHNIGNGSFKTRSINQIEAFKSKALSNFGKILKHAGDLADPILFIKETANNDGQMNPISMLGFGATTYVSAEFGFLPGVAAGLAFDTLGHIAEEHSNMINNEVKKDILNFSTLNYPIDIIKYNIDNMVFNQGIEVIMMPSSILNDYLTGKIKTEEALQDAIWSDENMMLEKNSAILIERVDNDTSIVHRVYLEVDDTPVKDKK